tara:strand:- start:89 stop:325 length:237 start_codon:yes stop_codon:yes gene_type:complete
MIDEKKFITVISKAINYKKANLKLKKGSIDEWDSLGHLAILSAVDKLTKGKTEKIKNISNFSSLSQLYDKLKKAKLAK